ncbi:hypothetical protein [Nocardioides sp.]|uniref:hypothetical protein n=1 Tax=Nocardioides sp. TaxID=35761 RepID=UPI002C6BCE3A|nr:hypothetical protein [Nocardioides sp.]HSX68922.1 hypothetical protein [Nocardioides sp.]
MQQDTMSEQVGIGHAAQAGPAPLGRSGSLNLVFFVWLGVAIIVTYVGPDWLSSGILFGGLLVAWGLVLAIAAATAPPPRLAEISILADRLNWLARATWASVVVAGSAVFSSVVAIELTKSAKSPELLNDAVGDVFLEAVGSLAGPVATVAAVLASSTVPVQLWRAGVGAREQAVARLLRPMREAGLPTSWLARLMMELSTLWVGLFVCYFGPPLLLAVALMAWAR